MPTVQEALNRADAERRALVAQLGAANRTARALHRTLRGYLDDWHALLQGDVLDTRRLFNVVLRDRFGSGRSKGKTSRATN